MSVTNRQRITIDIDPDLPLQIVHGVMGGVNQAGEIEIDLYSQCEDLPGPSELLVTEDGRLLNEHHLDEDYGTLRKFTRTVHTRAVLSPENARILAVWLMTQVDRASSARASDAVSSMTFDEPQSNSRQ